MCCGNIIRLNDGIETGIKNLVEQPVSVLAFFLATKQKIKAIIYEHILRTLFVNSKYPPRSSKDHAQFVEI